MATKSQREFLIDARTRLAQRHGKLTWDAFAELTGLSPRALKTYRLPEDSAEFRSMPPFVRKALEDLVSQSERTQSDSPGTFDGLSGNASSVLSAEALLPAAVAALVVRQVRQVLIERRAISGIERYPGDQLGLQREDRTAMALVSRARLRTGLPDMGAEIHDLLVHCTRPLGEWLNIPLIHEERLGHVTLLDSEELVPTFECEELARRFTNATTALEELLFSRLVAELQKSSRAMAQSYYTRLREFIVRNPIATGEDLRALISDLPSQIGVLISQEFYQAIPEGWGTENGQLTLCGHCGNALKFTPAGITCRTRACSETFPSANGKQIPLHHASCLARGISQYWLEPGFDELRLYDELRALQLPANLYPQMDRVDIDIGDIGIDLKAYVSPELLGERIRRNIGGLAFYRRKWLVIPDRLIRRVPAYLERLRASLKDSPVRAFAASSVAEELTNA